MEATIFVLCLALIIASRIIWRQIDVICDQRAANDRTQAEIRALEARLLELTK
jgi:hypothetical protein